MKTKRIFAAFVGALVFTLLMMLFDRSTDPETFAEEHYWRRPVILGAVMFIAYLLPDYIKNISWKELFAKFKKH